MFSFGAFVDVDYSHGTSRQANRKLATHPRLADYFDTASKHFAKALGNCEPKTRSAIFACGREIRLYEGFK